MTPQDQGRPATRLAEVAGLDCCVISPDTGLYRSFVELGDEIEQQQPIGQGHYPDDLGKRPLVTRAPHSGFLLCKRPTGRVSRGDNIAISGQNLDLGGRGLR